MRDIKDEYVNKGPDRPVFSQEQRAESLAALDCVDYVAINDNPTSVNVINLIQPDVYAKGDEYREEADDVTGNIKLEKEWRQYPVYERLLAQV